MVIFTKESDYYHEQGCAEFEKGRHGSQQAGYTLHPVRGGSEEQARAAGKRPCGHCLASAGGPI